MELVRKLVWVLASFFLVVSAAYGSVEQLRIVMSEQVDQTVYYNPLKWGSGVGTWADPNENVSSYNITGYITVTNQNPEGSPMSDIYISFGNTENITLPTLFNGRNGTFLSTNTSSGALLLHIPEVLTGENSTWRYYVNTTNIRPPLNITSSYSLPKVLSGDNLTVTDTVENVFDNITGQETCIYGINITQVTNPVSIGPQQFNYQLVGSTLSGLDGGNASISTDNHTVTWSVWAGNCFYKGNQTNINYTIISPLSIPKSDHYRMLNATLVYSLNATLSHLSVTDIVSISEANLSFEKQILAPAHPTLYGSNVTWNVSGFFGTWTSVNYTLHDVTFWVSQRNVNGSYTDPNYIDNDTINTTHPLNITYNPAFQVTNISSWISGTWLFNYSDVPSPIVWMDVNFSITNDGVQLINRTIVQNGNDIYLKELYIIIGYWLIVEKNITSLGNDVYRIKVDVHNKGNQVTPADSIVTVYDFVPSNFNVSSRFNYSNSPWYTSSNASTNINGAYNGTLYQWAITPTNVILNTSLASGPDVNENTTWSVEFNVTGQGDYTLLDVFITGLDPQKVDGAGSTRAVVVQEILDRLSSTEGIFAVVAGILLLLGLLL